MTCLYKPRNDQELGPPSNLGFAVARCDGLIGFSRFEQMPVSNP